MFKPTYVDIKHDIVSAMDLKLISQESIVLGNPIDCLNYWLLLFNYVGNFSYSCN